MNAAAPAIKGTGARPRSVLPGFSLAMGITLGYVGLVVLLPLAMLSWRAAGLGPEDFWRIVSGPRAVASYLLTLRAAFFATILTVAYGLLMAWVLVRYRFPGRRLIDAAMDLPFALPTAVAGIALTALYAKNGWLGGPLAEAGISVAYTQIGVAIAMAFVSVPFVVRTVQPVLEDLDPEIEEAARSLGATDWQVFHRVILPSITPALLAGGSLAFARCLGEFGAIIFIAGNLPFKTEITALLIFIRLEEYDYPAAAAIALVVLGSALAMLLVVNTLQGLNRRWAETRG